MTITMTLGVSDCNQKLIGAQFFVAGFQAENLADTEYLSARDADAHGTYIDSQLLEKLGWACEASLLTKKAGFRSHRDPGLDMPSRQGSG